MFLFNGVDLEDLTQEIEKQLDLSAKLDNSLLNTIGDKSTYKKQPPGVPSTATSTHGDVLSVSCCLKLVDQL